MNEPNPPPGWYPDPAASGGWRWWTGIEWSAHRTSSGVAFHGDRALERAAARRTEAAVLVRQLVTAALVFAAPEEGESFHRWSEISGLSSGTAATQASVAAPYGGLVTIGGLCVLISWIFLVVWQFRSGRVARALGYRAHRSPGWGVATWFIPVVNFWMPAEALADLLPPGDRLRRTMWWCWAGYLVSLLLNVAVFVLPAARDIPPVAAYHALVAADVALNLAIGGFLVAYVRGVEANHAESLKET